MRIPKIITEGLVIGVIIAGWVINLAILVSIVKFGEITLFEDNLIILGSELFLFIFVFPFLMKFLSKNTIRIYKEV